MMTIDLRRVLADGIVYRAEKVIKVLDIVYLEPIPEATHDLSTSLRRLLVAHQVSKQLFNLELLGKYSQDQIKNFRLSLGKVRDVQEMYLKVKALATTDELIAAFLIDLANQEKTARNTIQADIEDFDRSAILNLARTSQIQNLSGLAPLITVEDLVLKYYRRISKLYQPAVIEQSDKSLHQMRLHYKRLRYTLELLAPIFTTVDKQRLAYLRTFQQIMGEAHDWYIIYKAIKEFILNTSQTKVDQLVLKIEQLRFGAHQKAREYLTAEWANLQFFISSITSK